MFIYIYMDSLYMSVCYLSFKSDFLSVYELYQLWIYLPINSIYVNSYQLYQFCLSIYHLSGKSQFSFQSQRRAMPKNVQLLHNCTHFTSQQGNVQNPSSQASTLCELRTCRYTSWIQKRSRNQRSNCQHLLEQRKSKRTPEKHVIMLH